MSRFHLVACIVAFGVLPAAAQGPIGLNQQTLVVVCRYQGTEAPLFTSQQWADALNLHVNNFYLQASGGLTSFNFIPVPGVCALGYPDDQQTTDDAINYINSVTREGADAVAFAQAAGFNLANARQLVVIVNRAHRGNATIGHWPLYTVNGLPFQSLGLTVFGEVSFGVPLMGGDVLSVDMTESGIDVAAHELGHILGQFDLYPYFPGVVFSDRWTQMGNQTWQNFDAFSRFLYGWLPTPSIRVRDFVMPTTAAVNQVVNLAPPTSGTAQTEAIRISLKPEDGLIGAVSRPFFGLVLEGRPQVNLDANLPDEYEEGVLVSLVTEGLPQASYIVQPRVPTDSLDRAAFRPGDSFSIAELGVTVDVLGRTGNNFATRVRWTVPSLPDVALNSNLLFGESSDIWLDSPTNGFGNFTFPMQPGGGAPILCGDFPTVPFVIPWTDPDGPGLLPPLPGLPVPSPVTHRINLRARNVGTATATGVRGNIIVLAPTIPNVDLSDPANLLALGTPQTVNFGNIAPGGSATRTFNYRPDGTPFMVIAWFDKVNTEVNLFNQVAGEAFLIFQPAPGSPYDPVSVHVDYFNLDTKSKVRALFALPFGVPTEWQVSMDRVAAPAEPGQRIPFELRMRAPEREKPQLVTPRLMGWTDFGDAAVPIGELPVYVDLSVRTTTELQVKFDGKTANFTGRVLPGKAGLKVTLAVSGSDGSLKWLGQPEGDVATLTTDGGGNFLAAMNCDEKVQYSAVATFVGAPEMQPSVSPRVDFPTTDTGGGGGRRPSGPIIRRIQIDLLPRILREPFILAERRGVAPPMSVELIDPGVVVDWTNGRILSDGDSGPLPQLPGERRRQTERRNAINAALKGLRSAAEQLPVTADSTLGAYMQVSRELGRQVDELLNGFRVVDEREKRGGGFEVTLAVGLKGREGILSRVLPAVQALEQAAQRRLPAVQGERVLLTPNRPTGNFPTRSLEPFTGLVIDGSGLDLRRAMAPKIVLEDETEVWGTVMVDIERVREEGIVGYLPSLDQALDADVSRAGRNPLVITAVGVAGRFRANPVVTAEDAELIQKENERGHFLDQLRVVFVVD